MEKVSYTHDNFEKFALRVAGDDVSGYRELMRMPVKEFVRVAEAWLMKIIHIQKRSKKWRNK